MSSSKPKMAFVINLPKDYYVAIGEIAATWNWLEHQLGVLIRLGFKLSKPEGRILTASIGMKAKTSMLRITALKMVEKPAIRKALIDLATNVKEMTDDRNEYVHGLWVETVDTPEEIGLFVTRSGEQKFQPDFNAVPIDKLQKIVARLRELQDEAIRLTRLLKGKQLKL